MNLVLFPKKDQAHNCIIKNQVDFIYMPTFLYPLIYIITNHQYCNVFPDLFVLVYRFTKSDTVSFPICKRPVFFGLFFSKSIHLLDCVFILSINKVCKRAKRSIFRSSVVCKHVDFTFFGQSQVCRHADSTLLHFHEVCMPADFTLPLFHEVCRLADFTLPLFNKVCKPADLALL